MTKAKLTIDTIKLQKELQSKGYSQKEIDKVLLGANDINTKNFFSFEDVYKFLLKKEIHVGA